MRYILPLCLFLSGCSSGWVDAPAPPSAVQPVGPPSQEALQKGIGSSVKEARLTQPVEISALRRTDHGPGDYFVCLREAAPVPGRPHYTFSVFFNNDVYEGSRQSVLFEECEQQQYSRLN
ncbi:hypothetical protein [Bradyrhizobium sp. CCGUVB23]|uniref:hypothetical protein n=1 Tax=Bradyrhizobium sp. CCGUVB23 TaxID=2949630 RepID=UPI0020B332B7|nr:hypothetical protein [Bradyrhizobium sp. CCGUVB23]MCP3464996.1 hypothetical protein [Bradyrhizobium sp. CCGUVB23]